MGTVTQRHTWLRRFAAPFALLLVCLGVYNANLRQIGAGDTLPARFLPLLVWHDASVELGAQAPLVAQGHPPYNYRPVNTEGKAQFNEPPAYWLIRTRAHLRASFYPVVAPLLVAPLYLPVARWLDAQGWQPAQVSRVAEWMEKGSASLLAALASVLMFLVLRREGHRWAWPLTLAFALGTNTWMISSQALWQHGAGELLIAGALWFALAPPSPGRVAWLGFLGVLMTVNRPPDGLIAAAFGAFVLWRSPRDAIWLVAGGAVPLAASLAYNLGFIGDLAGGYGVIKPPRSFYQDPWSGLAGLLVSPSRGLLVFTPFLLFVPVGLRERLRAPPTRALAIALGIAVAAQLVLYAHGDWRAGASWGPRWLTDLLPILIWMLAPAPERLRPVARGALAALMFAAVSVQVIGAFWYTKASDDAIFAGADMRGAWDWQNVPFLSELRHGPAAAELPCDTRGSLDRLDDALAPDDAAEPLLQQGSVLEGWALACSRTPAQIAFFLDGVIVASTSTFLPRADVDAAFHTQAPSGWRMTANVWGIEPGERMLQFAVRIAPRSEFRLVHQQRVRVEAPAWRSPGAAQVDLPSAAGWAGLAANAAAALREHQTPAGAWLTLHTPKRQFSAPQRELNTFTTSVLVDLLAPLAATRDLDATLDRARAHLAAQIEGTGLVRYHGLPDAPGIGTLGCVITPDADDTALAWRIAGRDDDPRKPAMLATLAAYRDARGLYRTWLAPPRQYQCLDPGSDPDPTDFAIQLHVYLMLHRFDPPAAQALCAALQRSQRDEDLWVYYAKTTLLPMLRVAELRAQGCDLALPVARLALPAEGQATWSDAVRQLVELQARPDDANARAVAQRILAHLAADDFALLRATPPLLYHNDLSATVGRYYWSEDVGYALWLRLYAAAGLDAGAAAGAAP